MLMELRAKTYQFTTKAPAKELHLLAVKTKHLRTWTKNAKIKTTMLHTEQWDFVSCTTVTKMVLKWKKDDEKGWHGKGDIFVTKCVQAWDVSLKPEKIKGAKNTHKNCHKWAREFYFKRKLIKWHLSCKTICRTQSTEWWAILLKQSSCNFELTIKRTLGKRDQPVDQVYQLYS